MGILTVLVGYICVCENFPHAILHVSLIATRKMKGRMNNSSFFRRNSLLDFLEIGLSPDPSCLSFTQYPWCWLGYQEGALPRAQVARQAARLSRRAEQACLTGSKEFCPSPTLENKPKQPMQLMMQYTLGRRGPGPAGCGGTRNFLQGCSLHKGFSHLRLMGQKVECCRWD